MLIAEKPHDRIFIHLDTIPERDGRTDRRMDRQNHSGYYSVASNADAL